MKIFSHVYIEESIKEHPRTTLILKKLKDSKMISIKYYKEIFCRPFQNFLLQKKKPSLILAKKKNKFTYPIPEVCQNFGFTNAYYASPVLNCIYNCSYCFLQGMYSSAYVVVFVNQEDFLNNVKSLIENKPISLSISYDTDLLSIENILGFAKEWIEFAYKNPSLILEIRTKSANYKAISHLTPAKNIVLAWTLLPEEIISSFEENTPSLKIRLKNIQSAIEDGWNIRLCFDPIFDIENAQEVYKNFFRLVFSKIPPEKFFDISIGFFRMNKEYFKKVKVLMPSEKIFLYPYSYTSKVISYDTNTIKKLTRMIKKEVSTYVGMEKIFFYK